MNNLKHSEIFAPAELGLTGVKEVLEIMIYATCGSYGYKFFVIDEDCKGVRDVTRDVAFVCKRKLLDSKIFAKAGPTSHRISCSDLYGKRVSIKFDANSEVMHLSDERVHEELNECYDILKSFGILTQRYSILVTDMTLK